MDKFSREFFAKAGRKGGKVGGKSRMKTMTARERKRIAREAAKASWSPEARKKRKKRGK